MSSYEIPNWPCTQPPPLTAGLIRQQADDFQVDEKLPFELSGEGEHVWLKIRKRQLTTSYVASCVSKWAGVKRMATGFAGQKDRHAETTQWFSIQLPGKSLPESAFTLAGCEVLEVKRHLQKLRRGILKENHFKIRIRSIAGETDRLEKRIREISEVGVPNYFTEQRFGRNGDNVTRAAAFFRREYRPKGREQRSMLISASRSWLFNQVLAHRVVEQNWNQALPGELLMLSGSHSIFAFDEKDLEIPARLASADVNPTGPLPGSGDSRVAATVDELESRILNQYAELVDGLIKAGVKTARRSLRLIPQALTMNWEDKETLCLSFSLPSGSYATAVLRELVDYRDVARES